jgi:hypothetical protein
MIKSHSIVKTNRVHLFIWLDTDEAGIPIVLKSLPYRLCHVPWPMLLAPDSLHDAYILPSFTLEYFSANSTRF